MLLPIATVCSVSLVLPDLLMRLAVTNALNFRVFKITKTQFVDR